jgi:hypothetical protein
MNIVFDRETRIAGLGLTQEEAYEAMSFYVERSGKITRAREDRRKEIHTWLPRPNILHVKDVGAILYEKNYFTNLATGRKVRVQVKPLSHYLCLFNAFDGRLSFEDFTITIAPEVNKFLSNISDKFLTLNDFPYINPVEKLDIKSYHKITAEDIALVETKNDTIVLSADGKIREVGKTVGIDTDCLVSYLFASCGYLFDGKELRRISK